jgi:AraC-like DNA-binding protein
LKAQDFIEAHAQEKLTVGTISDEVLMSERTFIRRFKAATGNLPSEYIQRVKVEHAKKLLEEGKENIKEISYKSGYEDLNYFRDIFKRYTGLTPMEYKKMYSFSVD